MSSHRIALTVNGVPRQAEVPARLTLADFLRERLDLTANRFEQRARVLGQLRRIALRFLTRFRRGLELRAGFVRELFGNRRRSKRHVENVVRVGILEDRKRFEFSGDVLHIGAVGQDGGSKNEVVVPDAELLISRFHCEIHRRGSKFYVFDVKSANGTFVDKRRIKPGRPVRLRNGSRVDLAGVCSLRLGFDRKGKPDA